MRSYQNIEPRRGLTIKEVIVVADNVYIKTADGDLYRVWIGFDALPLMELIERG